MEQRYEWCVMHEALGFDAEPHRGPMAEDEAHKWVRRWDKDGGCVGAFHVARRTVGTWERVERANTASR